MVIEYRTRVLDPTNSLARSYIRSLSSEYDLCVTNTHPNDTSYLGAPTSEYLSHLIQYRLPAGVVIHHMIPTDISLAPGKVNVGVVTPKTTTIPPGWVMPCNQLDLIITPNTGLEIVILDLCISII